MNPYQVPGRIITFFNYGLRIMKCGDLRKMAIVQCNCFPLCLPHLTVTFQGVFRNNFILACQKKRKTGRVLARKKVHKSQSPKGQTFDIKCKLNSRLLDARSRKGLTAVS